MAVIGGVNCSLANILILIALTILNVNVKLTNSAWFESCKHQYTLKSNGLANISSPYYPKNYPSATSCIYVVTAPENHQITVDCNIDIYEHLGEDCTTDYLFVVTYGDVDLRGSNHFCGINNVHRNSFANKLVLGYISSTNDYSGRFTCFLRAVPRNCECGWTSPEYMRISGGVKARKHEFPFLAGLIYTGDPNIFCGGSIISHHYILTAAHCVIRIDINKLEVVVGGDYVKTEQDTRYIRYHKLIQIKLHENFRESEDKNDIAILRTKTPIEWTPGVGPVCLPFLYSNETLVGRNAVIMGWGTTTFGGIRANVLLKAEVKLISNSECRKSFPNITEADVCHFSPPKDSCQYDSGGPVIVRGKRQFLMGIITFGEGCTLDIPSPNLRITSYLDWIVANTNENFCRQKLKN